MSYDLEAVRGMNRAERALWRSWVWLETAISDRVKVLTTFVTVVVVDTYMTMWGVESGLVREANPFMVGVVEAGAWEFMLGFKFLTVCMVIFILYMKDTKSKASRIVINYIFLVGILVVLWNSLHLGLAIVVG